MRASARNKLQRVSSSANHNRREVRWRLTIGAIDCRKVFLNDPHVANVVHDPHDRHPRMVRVFLSDLDMFAQGILALEITASETLADNRGGRSLSSIGIRQQTPIAKGDVQDAEIIRSNRFNDCFYSFTALRGRTPLNRKVMCRKTASIRVRNIADEGGGLHSWRRS